MHWEKIKGTFANRRGIYCVTAQKLILNVSKIRLRLIFACALYLRRLFAKALEGCAAAANSPRRIRTDRDVRGSTQQHVCIANV